jgi:uncharacterized tellurite resistance protein B-like protein
MIERLKRLLASGLADDRTGEETRPDLRLATAALLLEMARADRTESSGERDAATELLARHFRIEQGAAERLLGEADQLVEGSVSLFDFTSVLNETLSNEERRRVVQMIAEVAAADGRFDKFEQHLLARLADLLHLRRAEYSTIRAAVLERARTRRE